MYGSKTPSLIYIGEQRNSEHCAQVGFCSWLVLLPFPKLPLPTKQNDRLDNKLKEYQCSSFISVIKHSNSKQLKEGRKERFDLSENSSLQSTNARKPNPWALARAGHSTFAMTSREKRLVLNFPTSHTVQSPSAGMYRPLQTMSSGNQKSGQRHARSQADLDNSS